MPKLSNKQTGKEYYLTQLQFERMQKEKPHILNAFNIVHAKEPEVVKSLKQNKDVKAQDYLK